MMLSYQQRGAEYILISYFELIGMHTTSDILQFQQMHFHPSASTKSLILILGMIPATGRKFYRVLKFVVLHIRIDANYDH
jgi:hypothetical protein